MGAAEFILEEGQYLSISQPIDFEQTIQRSRFIASIRRVQNRSEFDSEMKKIMQLYPKATHYCWAYRFCDSGIQEHATDAGEPAGTAGRPILGALKKHSLLNVMAVVTRYYGGVKLGVKGLIAAYGQTALLGIEQGEIIVCEANSTLRFQCDYDLYNIFLARLEREKVDISKMHVVFTEFISGEITMPNSLLARLLPFLKNLSPGRSGFDFSLQPASADHPDTNP